MNWSHYQTAIFDFVETGRGDGIVNAVAGAGKSSTLVECARRVRGNAVFCAFNKHIVDSLTPKLAGTSATAKTIHSIGMGTLYGALGKPQIEEQKYLGLCREWVDQNYDKIKTADSKPGEMVSTLRKLSNFARMTLADANDPLAIHQMAMHYGLAEDWNPALAAGVPQILADGQRMARTMKIIDFADMLYLPYAWDLRPRPVQWVLVDECQDLSRAQLHLVLKLREAGGRMLFVGDPAQSIQAFAGADNESFSNIRDTTSATELPLSICYRCPTSHIDLAKSIVPHIEAAPGAQDGKIEWIDKNEVARMLRSGDLVLCRRNAPLIGLCIELISSRIQARVRGRDVGKELANLVRKIGNETLTYKGFPTAVNDWKRKQLERLAAIDASEDQLAEVADKANALLACFDGYPRCQSTDELSREVENMFSDEHAAIWLSTVHRAKGLEENRVFVLQPDILGKSRPGALPWQSEQERNLEYVAYTRSKSELYFVEDAERENKLMPLLEFNSDWARR